jgi:MscS family membrane protein
VVTILYLNNTIMQEFLDKIILNNNIRSYISVIGVILVALVFKRYLTKYIAGWLYKLVSNREIKVKKESFLNKVIKPLDWFLILLVSIIAIDKLNFPEVLNFKILKVSFKAIIESVSNGAMVIVFIWLCRRMIDFIAIILEEKANQTEDPSDNQLIVFFKDFFKVILVIIGILLILRFSFHKNIGNLLTGLSIVGAAIALSLRESLENLIASFIIFFNKPFVTGDIVKVHNFTGTVEKVGLRSTRIRTDVKTYITVPNKQMVDSILDNITLRTQRKIDIRLEISLAVSYTKLNTLTNTLQTIVTPNEEIENSLVYFQETGKNAHIYAIEVYTSMSQSINDFNALREKINIAILEILEANHIELAAKSADITIHKNES